MMKTGFYIHELAEKVQLHPSTIRRYLRRGLISEPKREWCGWRVFSDQHIKEIEDLRRLR